MGLDGVVDGIEVLGWVVVFAEKGDGMIGGEAGGLGAKGGVFGDVQAVVEISGGQEDIERKVFARGELAGVENHALDVLEVVCGVSIFLGGEESAEEGDPVGIHKLREKLDFDSPVEVVGRDGVGEPDSIVRLKKIKVVGFHEPGGDLENDGASVAFPDFVRGPEV